MVTLSDTPVLTTERLVLRAPQAGDWPAWRDFAASGRSRHILDGRTDAGFAWRVFGHAVGHWVLRGYGMFVLTLRDGNRPIGMAGPWFPEGWPEHELGWTIWTSEAEGRGYASEAARATLDFARAALGWVEVVSYIDPDNLRSIALAERLGARRDAGAAVPCPDEPCLVYRHPREAR
ncbi:N-acetyltransferase [Paracoccus subflavus]|uniref:N-acetyltransferase n=1 Tax=Paracoccus subflavus TaxID=2528244 RepID=A0A4Q9FWK5_9RHOB|nr:GNAT family N-acetyltransferase [Paracoccus subflavus]TBN38016.1 N-acetyltransferase [Paracoccus subflavus]